MQVLAVSRNPRHSFSKQPQESIRLIAGEGVEGDAHRGHTVQHLYRQRRNALLPNLCQVHLFPNELLEELAAKRFALAPGEIGENILTEGVDLLALPQGTLLHLGTEAIVEVTGLRTPCSQIERHRAGLQQLLYGPRDAAGKKTLRCGVMATVQTGGQVSPGTVIQAELPAGPHMPLGPV